jgi:hypothetical protein
MMGMSYNEGGYIDGNTADALFNRPNDITIDASGNLYVADTYNHKIRKITASSILSGDTTGQVGEHNVVLDATDGNGGTVQQIFTIDIVVPVLSKNGEISFTNPNYVNKNGAVNTIFGLSATGAVIAVKDPPLPANVGDLRAGGIVFWVNPEDNTHGLVCALEGVSNEDFNNTELDWGDAMSYSNSYTNSDTGTGVHSDWYLPSKEELQLMYANLQRFGCSTETPGGSDENGLCATRKGNLLNSYYWNSTEIDDNNAWRQSFGNGAQNGNDKIEANTVRAVRAF